MPGLYLGFYKNILTVCRQTWEGGIIGCVGGAAVGSLGVWAASRRSHAFRQLTVPLRVFLGMVPMIFGGECLEDITFRSSACPASESAS